MALNRYGDTAFRLSNQTSFYTNILSFLYDKENRDEKVISSDIYDFCISESIINYKSNSIGLDSRSNMMIKQLRLFELVEVENDGHIKLTNLGRNFISMIKDNQSKISKKYNIPSIMWFYIMINKSKLSNSFRKFVNNIYTNNNVSLELINFIRNGEESKTISDEDTIKILRYNSINKIVKLNKPLSVDKSLPELLNNLDYKEVIIDNNSKLKDCLKKCIRNINPDIIKISDIDIENYLENEPRLIIQNAIDLAYNTTINKDYRDINARWFINCGLLVKIGKELYVNENNKILYQHLQKIEFDENFFNLKNFLSRCNLDVKTVDNYPYHIEQLKDMLDKMNNNKWEQLKKEYELDGISKPTIFEYVVNLSFYLTYGKSVKEFRENVNTLLDNNLKPIMHAGGGKPDGTIYDNQNNILCNLEATILNRDKDIINKEKISCQEHAVKKIDEIKQYITDYEKEPMFILVMKDKNNNTLIHNFINNNEHYSDPSKKIKAAILTCNDILELINENKLINTIPYLYNNEINYSNDFHNLYDNYKNHISKIPSTNIK